MKTVRFRSVVTLIATASLLVSVPPVRAITVREQSAREVWIGMYLNGKKMGWTSVRAESAEFRGKPANLFTSTSTSKIELFGQSVSQDTKTVTYTDSSSSPLFQEYRIVSNGSTMELMADYLPGKIVCTVKSGGSVSEKVVSVPKGVTLVADSSDPTQGKRLKRGENLTFHYLNPVTVALEKTVVKVEAEETARLAGVDFKTFRVLATSPLGSVTTWETSDGELVKGEMSIGPVKMSMFREAKETALNMSSTVPEFVIAGAGLDPRVSAYVPPSDFAIATAIATNKPIANPRTATRLKLEISGIEDKSMAISDARQLFSPLSSKPGTWHLSVTAKRFAPETSVSLPIRDPELLKATKRAPLMEASDPEILKAAREIRGSETNSYKVAARIRAWVFGQMKPDYTIGVPRSTVEIFNKRKGVCRDYATLFAGLARAAGIPTRVCGGIVYDKGRFFYHAWAECWVGGWAPFDPTTPVDFVDATHIKFAQGDVTDMFRVASIVGKLKISVISSN